MPGPGPGASLPGAESAPQMTGGLLVLAQVCHLYQIVAKTREMPPAP